MSSPSGRHILRSVAGESYRAFVPFPPEELALDTADLDLVERANRALGRLDGITALLPDTELFIYFYVRKEALLSSQIEGTQSSFADLLLFESDEVPGVPLDDVREVSNYVAAMNYGLQRLEELPLSLRLIQEIHSILLDRGRGSEKAPGEFRRSQNWIGGSRPGNARFVPPPPEEVGECMGDLEKFIHDIPDRTPLLIKAAFAHVQFETIHPFLDGNGRLGRLLVTLLLCAEGALREPTLYLSLYLKNHRQEYYDLLQRVRDNGEWKEWLRFFLKGIDATATQAVNAARSIAQLFEADSLRINQIGRRAGSALRVQHYMRSHPLVTANAIAEALSLSKPTIGTVLDELVKLNILHEVTGRQRDRLYTYDKYLKILDEGTEPIRKGYQHDTEHDDSHADRREPTGA